MGQSGLTPPPPARVPDVLSRLARPFQARQASTPPGWLTP
ncbi:hypothetical protein SA22_3787 [Salmonella enterica subsp. enterica serovar Agona str. 22.H.04]|uniref:Uncharacterized protein n=1 Tax=Salmonella agona (strain SL483) TaxID=454166 RepID=B5F0X6_SALA4|nr:conserved hypothetical protein [Salmonella enterica subsp. enterica serovar Agona str. SL483]EDZ34440.1 conserved hypothetical protein [Salmonella enterica subsp. enterica serovar Hadar str. RI_05P066]QDX87684.1 hypothetical protein FORC93_1633 [Salmonella enterica subsp. enterica serovar Braenderup]CCR00292.1 hypothetical protein SA73_1508 [Salmonella enterica subsp. enterica serovar Agona str. 73.H.09]CCR06950.1 hypothetical protein SA72_3534 [Salmonella enterica subsp. enterica serovar Ag